MQSVNTITNTHSAVICFTPPPQDSDRMAGLYPWAHLNPDTRQRMTIILSAVIELPKFEM
ncbi:hypothetical protein [Allocoleopsis sp.]|uniref:hypothetical protein n=1 Tax=Allocoleopsis sp. TaxID=3088169 RepID=UPI002FCEB724